MRFGGVAFLATDACDVLLHLRTDGPIAVAIFVVRFAAIGVDEAAPDGTLLTAGHLVVEMHHASSVARCLVFAIHLAVASLYVRIHGVHGQDVDGRPDSMLRYQPVEATQVLRAFVVEAMQIMLRLFMKSFFFCHS